MSATYSTITLAGVEKSFAGWNLAFDVTDELFNQKPDIFTATLLGANLATETATPTFPFEGIITVQIGRISSTGAPNSFSGGTITFSGKRVGNPARATGSRQGVTYQFQGPWYDLMNTDYQQLFYGASGVSYLLPEVVLNTSTAVTTGQVMCSVGDQIQAILQWLLDQYTAQGMTLPFQYTGRLLNAGKIDLDETSGVYNYAVSSATTIDPSLFLLFLPSYIAKPMKCADAIQKCLQLSPRVTCSFDYSTNPPTFHAALVDNMTAVNLPVLDGATNTQLNIRSRPDLVARSVNLIYRVTTTVNGQKEISYTQDKYGPNGSNNAADPDTGLRVINELLDMSGVTASYTTAHLDVEPVLATAAAGGSTQALKRGWWSEPRGGNVSKLADSRVRFQDQNGNATTIPDAVITDAQTGAVLQESDLIAYGLVNSSGALVLNRLVRGSVHAWMTNPDGTTVVSKKIHVASSATYAEYDATSTSGTPDTDTTGNRLSVANSKQMHADLEVSNGLTQAYTTLASVAPGEQIILGANGIAAYLYNHMKVLQYEGDYTQVGVSFGGVSLINAINFTGGATAWATMRAQCQGIRRHYGRMTTQVQIGINKYLSAGQLSSLFNMWRFRRPWYNPLLRTQNTVQNSNVDQAIATGNANSPEGLVNPQINAWLNYATQPTGSTPGTVSSAIIAHPEVLSVHDGLN